MANSEDHCEKKNKIVLKIRTNSKNFKESRMDGPAYQVPQHNHEENKKRSSGRRSRTDSESRSLNFEEEMATNMKVLQLIEDSSFSMTQINGQRRLGPPPEWKGPPPGPGCEIFVGKIPRTLYENDLYPIFKTVGEIYEIRLMMDFSGTNRGYCFIMYTKPEYAKRAVKELDQYEIRKGNKIGVVASINNCRLFIGRIPPSTNTETIVRRIYKLTNDVDNVAVYRFPNSRPGYAILSYQTHRGAAMARRRLVPESLKLVENVQVIIEWAHPDMSPINVYEELATLDSDGKLQLQHQFIPPPEMKKVRSGKKRAKHDVNQASKSKDRKSLSPIRPPNKRTSGTKKTSSENAISILKKQNQASEENMCSRIAYRRDNLMQSRLAFKELTTNGSEVYHDINDNEMKLLDHAKLEHLIDDNWFPASSGELDSLFASCQKNNKAEEDLPNLKIFETNLIADYSSGYSPFGVVKSESSNYVANQISSDSSENKNLSIGENEMQAKISKTGSNENCYNQSNILLQNNLEHANQVALCSELVGSQTNYPITDINYAQEKTFYNDSAAWMVKYDNANNNGLVSFEPFNSTQNNQMCDTKLSDLNNYMDCNKMQFYNPQNSTVSTSGGVILFPENVPYMTQNYRQNSVFPIILKNSDPSSYCSCYCRHLYVQNHYQPENVLNCETQCDKSTYVYESMPLNHTGQVNAVNRINQSYQINRPLPQLIMQEKSNASVINTQRPAERKKKILSVKYEQKILRGRPIINTTHIQ
ncbi:uncharacterized protein [Prorops nasuta]|uniref:uncharacterized protein n=1 Tax=Prorops nasuta TaxID=863751 RepID=UPI0034CDC0A0